MVCADFGLAIVKRIAKTLNIRIGVRSTPGRGSVFFVTVPFGDHHGIPPALGGAGVLALDELYPDGLGERGVRGPADP